MNFRSVYEKGQRGENSGLDTGIPGLNRAVNGINKKSIYTVAAAPKVGKSTLVDFCFVISPYLEWVSRTEAGEDYDIEWHYYSYEVDRVQKEFKFACYFMFRDYGIWKFTDQQSGETIELDSEYLLGRKRRKDGSIIFVLPEHEEKLREIYRKRIIPLFGEYDESGRKIKPGKINFIENKNNPTGIKKDFEKVGNDNGEVQYEPTEYTDEKGNRKVGKRAIGYVPKNPKKFIIFIFDHIRKLLRERSYSLKENIDKMAEYMVEARNLLGFTIVPIVHMNRNVVDPMRLKLMGEWLFATSDDIKDSGNLSEESDYVLTLFNPNDEKYNLKRHFNVPLQDNNGNLLHPNYRSIHLVESRHTVSPIHVQVDMYGGINYFTSVNYK